jgi:hypothetical protein
LSPSNAGLSFWVSSLTASSPGSLI